MCCAARRAGLARSFETCTAQFRRLLAAAVGSESRVLRAALVRLCARAGGEDLNMLSF